MLSLQSTIIIKEVSWMDVVQPMTLSSGLSRFRRWMNDIVQLREQLSVFFLS